MSFIKCGEGLVSDSTATGKGGSADMLEENKAQNRLITVSNRNSLFCIAEKTKLYLLQKRDG